MEDRVWSKERRGLDSPRLPDGLGGLRKLLGRLMLHRRRTSGTWSPTASALEESRRSLAHVGRQHEIWKARAQQAYRWAEVR